MITTAVGRAATTGHRIRTAEHVTRAAGHDTRTTGPGTRTAEDGIHTAGALTVGSRTAAGRGARRAGALLAGACAAALVLTGCDGQGGGASSAAGSVPSGWGTLKTRGVDVSYPKPAYREQGAGERSGYDAAAAVRTEQGVKVSLITVQLDFTQAGSAEDAAVAAEAGVQLGATIKGDKKVKVHGTDDARRVDFDYGSTGKGGTPPKGTRISGVILTGLDSKGKTFAVRIDAREGLLPDADLKKIVDSVEVH
jgi:hypothetical protein